VRRAALVALFITFASAPGTGAGPAAAPQMPALQERREAYYHYSLAQGERLRRNYLQATRHLQRAIELDPTSGYLRLELARVLRTLRQTDQALEEIRQALALDPQEVEAHRLAAEIHVALMDAGTDTAENLAQAISHYEKVLSAAPQEADDAGLTLGRLYYYQGDLERALAVLERQRLQSSDLAELHFWIAKVHLGLQDLPAAEDSVRRALAIAPNNYESLLTLATIEESREAYDRAIEACEKALAVAQDSVEVRYALARLALKKNDFARAAREYQSLLALMKQRRPWASEAELADLHLFTARAQWFSGSPQKALESLREGGPEFATDVRFQLLEGELLIETGREKEGEKLLEKVLEQADDDREVRERVAEAYFSQGSAREREGKHALAERYLKRVIALHPEHANALNYLGYMLVETSARYAESLGYIEHAVRLEPDNGDFLDSLGWVYYKLNRFEDAERELRRAIDKADENAVVLDHLGDVLLERGQPEEAIRQWETALERARGLEHPERVRDKIKLVRKRISTSKP
jgi:tetratricopeptide (TPR) repeat protein